MVAPSGPPNPATWWDYVKLNVGVLGFLISVGLAVVKGYEIWNARRDRSRDQQAKVNDAWFKTIVLDGAIPDIRKFLEGQRASLKNARSADNLRPFMSAWQRYQPESEELMLRLIPLEELSARAYARIEREFERLADVISPFCSHADDASYPRQSVDKEWTGVQQQMDQCFRESLTVLRVLHLNLSRGRDPDTGIEAV
jgi:hypothetical protein